MLESASQVEEPTLWGMFTYVEGDVILRDLVDLLRMVQSYLTC